ncbi:hypothetical protein Tco_1124708, partial [Tanacetum coccineum]
MSEIDPEPPNPLNPLPPIDKSNEFTKTYKKSDKKPDKSLKPKKTTRTMNPDPKMTMKHKKMLYGTSHVSVKNVVTCSGPKEGVIGIVDEGMEDGIDDEEGMEAGMITNLNKNWGTSSRFSDVVPEIPIPVEQNPFLSTKLNMDVGIDGKLNGKNGARIIDLKR